jgi:hypothetical protein
MDRILIFAVIGPVVGVFAGIFVVIPLVAELSGEPFEFGLLQLQTFIAILPFSYVAGIIPALLASLVDWAMQNRSKAARIIGVSVAGYVLGFLPFWWPLQSGAKPSLWAYGIAGAIAGGACAWLTGRIQQVRIS